MTSNELWNLVLDRSEEEVDITVSLLKIWVESNWMKLWYFSNSDVSFLKYESTMNNLMVGGSLRYGKILKKNYYILRTLSCIKLHNVK